MSSGDEIECALDYILVPPSRNTFAELSCLGKFLAYLSAVGRHFEGSHLEPAPRPKATQEQSAVDFHTETPNPPKSKPGLSKIQPGASKIQVGGCKIEAGALKNATWKASCSPERSCGRPSSFLLPILNHLGSNLDAQEVPNRGPSMKKSMLKNKLFLASIFEGFGLRFGVVFGRFFGFKMHANSDRLICVKS